MSSEIPAAGWAAGGEWASTGRLSHDPGETFSAAGYCGRPECRQIHTALTEWEDGIAVIRVPHGGQEG